MTQTGVVFNIQKFSTHDGPGIRTTVFLKGCPLTCLWCSNPESQYHSPQLMVRDLKCSGCGACLTTCPESAISFSEDKKRQIDWGRCTNCFSCVDACLYGALTAMGQHMTAQEVVEEVEKDRVFYENSGGGATISGGEALGQHAFLEELLLLLKKKEIHRTLDTTGHAPASVITKIIPLVDLVPVDLRHLESDRHNAGTGLGNELILKNLKTIATHVKTWIRIPLIAGYNDSIEHITKVAELGASLKIDKVSFLPYHEGGISKITQIGMKDTNYKATAPDDEHLDTLLGIMKKHHIKATVRS